MPESIQLEPDKQLNPSVLLFNPKRQHKFDLKQKRERFKDIKLTDKDKRGQSKLEIEEAIQKLKAENIANKMRITHIKVTALQRGQVARIKFVQHF